MKEFKNEDAKTKMKWITNEKNMNERKLYILFNALSGQKSLNIVMTPTIATKI